MFCTDALRNVSLPDLSLTCRHRQQVRPLTKGTFAIPMPKKTSWWKGIELMTFFQNKTKERGDAHKG